MASASEELGVPIARDIGPSATRIARTELGTSYKRVFIVESRDWFASCRGDYDASTDLVLTYDFALKHEVRDVGGDAFYLDHLVDPASMERENFVVYEFFRRWNLDARGNDLFCYQGVAFGLAFRMDFWNDFVFFVRARLCVERLQQIEMETLYAGTELGITESILNDAQMPFIGVSAPEAERFPAYHFPIHRWLRKNTRRTGWKAVVVRLASNSLGTAFSWVDWSVRRTHRRPSVLVQEYHPTVELIRRLRQDGKVRVVNTVASRTNFWTRYVPQWSRPGDFAGEATRLRSAFRVGRTARLVLTSGKDVTDLVYSIIEAGIESRIEEPLRTIHDTIRYLEHNPLGLEILIANIGDATVLDCVCRARGIPTYLIINGLLLSNYLDEAKYATTINAYSSSIKHHYFRGMDNIVCLGDPRMDQYPPRAKRVRSSEGFIVTIGASGHSSVDLNSYVAVEFQFLFEVLSAISEIRAEGTPVRVIIKVRANGYKSQYQQFTREYFSDLDVEIVDGPSMRSVLERTDLFISIFSQTLFEASCMGIPCVYYAMDDQVTNPPFDGESELVSPTDQSGLVQALHDYLADDPRYDAFLQRSVMEKYVGPLDGGNLERNLAFVYESISGHEIKASA